MGRHSDHCKACCAAALLAATTSVWASGPSIRSDLGWHAGTSYAFGLMARTFSPSFVPIDNGVLRGTLLGTLPGLLKEIADSQAPGNHFSGSDMAANVVGALAGTVLGDRLFIMPTGIGDGRPNGVVIGIHRAF